MYFFLAARCVLAIGEAGYFPVAVKVTAEYFPKRDRAFATSIFNAGASIGALIAPLTIPISQRPSAGNSPLSSSVSLGFIWMGFWVFMYNAPEKSRFVNQAELAYIQQDKQLEAELLKKQQEEKKMPFLQCFCYRQTWAFALGKFLTDGVWWFFLFWTPSYLNTQFGIKMTEGQGSAMIFVLYAITMLSLYGGKLPTIFINRSGSQSLRARMRAMLIFAFVPLVVLFAQPLGTVSPWFSIIIIGIAVRHTSRGRPMSYTVVSDMFPRSAVATVTGIGGMAGGVSRC